MVARGRKGIPAVGECSEVVVGGLRVVGDDCRWSSGVVGCCRCSRVVVDANGYQLEKRMRIREKREGKM